MIRIERCPEPPKCGTVRETRLKAARIALRRALRAGDAKAVSHAWSRAKRGLLAPSQPFRALSHDALNVLVSDSDRLKYRLEYDELEL